MSNWSRGMIPASGAGGPEFDSRIGPVELYHFFSAVQYCVHPVVFRRIEIKKRIRFIISHVGRSRSMLWINCESSVQYSTV